MIEYKLEISGLKKQIEILKEKFNTRIPSSDRIIKFRSLTAVREKLLTGKQNQRSRPHQTKCTSAVSLCDVMNTRTLEETVAKETLTV